MNHKYEYVRHAVKIIVQLLPRFGLMLHYAAFVAIARAVSALIGVTFWVTSAGFVVNSIHSILHVFVYQ